MTDGPPPTDPTGAPPARAAARRVLPVVLFTVFLDMLGVGILIPVVPQLLGNPRSPDYLLPTGWTYEGGLILLGFLTASYPLAQFFAAPVLGQLSDRYGRRVVLALSLAGTSIGYAVFAVGILRGNIPLLFAARVFDGITGGNIAVAQAAVADVTPPEQRTRNFGFLGATFGLGFILGPYIGGKLAVPNASVWGLFDTPRWFDAATPFWFTTALAALNVVLVLVRLPETRRRIVTGPIEWGRSVHNIVRAATMPGLRTVFPVTFLFQGGFAFFTTFFSVYLTQKLRFSASNIGDFFAYVGLWIAVTQAALAGALAKRFRDDQIIRVTLIGLSGSLLVTFIPSSTAQLLLLAPLIPIFVGLSTANLTALVSRSVAPQMQGEVLGINSSVLALAQAIPAMLTGYLAGIDRNVPIIAASVAVGLGAIVFRIAYRPRDPEVAAPLTDR